jgi:plastocyanin
VVNDGSTVVGTGQIFSSPSFGLGQNYSFTFTNAGTYPYHCGIHLSMHGTVIVM